MESPALEAARSLQIIDVVIRRIEAETTDRFVPMVQQPSRTTLSAIVPRSIRLTTFQSPAPNAGRRFQYEVEATVRVFEANDAPDEDLASGQESEELRLATIKTVFLATYEEPGGACLSDDAVRGFAAQNVPHNVWPYWREVVHAVTSRMGLPRQVLPLFTLARRANEEPKSPSETKTVDAARS